jgi:hypothetical protein
MIFDVTIVWIFVITNPFKESCLACCNGYRNKFRLSLLYQI